MISVIVPIYNVEAYLRKCLDSLAAQTFADVEFLLIDDGSTDSSGEIADAYTDSRFRTFHTSNHGLSAARNFGIENANGDWLMFVDGDDYVTPDFCLRPYTAAIEGKADLVIFHNCVVKKGRICKKNRRNVPTGVITTETAIRGDGDVSWNKLYKRDLFDDIRYPNGMAYEDTAVIHRLVLKAKRILMLQDILYYYVYRSDGISHTVSAKHSRDSFVLSLQRYYDLRDAGFSGEFIEKPLLSSAIGFLVRVQPQEDEIYKKAEEIVGTVNRVPRRLKREKRMMLWIWKINPDLFHFICRILGQKARSSQ